MVHNSIPEKLLKRGEARGPKGDQKGGKGGTGRLEPLGTGEGGVERSTAISRYMRSFVIVWREIQTHYN